MKMQCEDHNIIQEPTEVSSDTEQQEYDSIPYSRYPGHCARQSQCGRDELEEISQQFYVKVALSDRVRHCKMCSESFPNEVALADHITTACSRDSTDAASQLWTEEQTHINYHDLISTVKLEVNENVEEMESEEISFADPLSVVCLNCTSNKDIVIGSENHPQLMVKRRHPMDEEHNLNEVVQKRIKLSDVENIPRNDQHVLATFAETRAGARQSNEHIKEKITKKQIVGPLLKKRDKLQEQVTNNVENPFTCNMCDYKCTQSSKLKVHMKTHTAEKLFACDVCNYKCIQKGNLTKHVRTHIEVKSFACNECDYKCIQSSDLKTHMRTHTGNKRFACNLCDYKCIQKKDLKMHIKKHTEVKPLACVRLEN